MASIIQMSDPHFGTEQPAVVEALVRLVAEEKPDLVILSGDITQRAQVHEFTAARRFVDRLGLPTFVIPGNHDIPLFNGALRAFAPYRRYQAAFPGPLEPRHASNDVLVIGLATTRRYRHKDGQVSRRQIESTSALLRQARPGQLRIVVMHHPVHVTRPADITNLLHGRAAAIRAWADAGADIIMGGHIHLPYVRSLAQDFDALPRQLWAVQAGTALSSRIRHEAPNSVNLLRHDRGSPGQARVERWDFLAGMQRFQPVTIDELLLGPVERTA
ncbi:metallophosphoesterase family protein [soil metagenome]